MLATQLERRTSPGVAVLTAQRSTLTSTLAVAELPHRLLLAQDDGLLPAMRPPVLLDTQHMSLLLLATTLHHLYHGRTSGWKVGTPLPTLAVVDPANIGHLRLLATSRAVVAVLPATSEPATFSLAVRHLSATPLHDQASAVWLGIPRPDVSYTGPDLASLLHILHQGNTVDSVCRTANIAPATLGRRLTQACAALGRARPGTNFVLERWRCYLIEAITAVV